MVAEGAAIVDVGGESTRPGHTPVTEEEELRRIVPVLEALRREIDAPISVDTSKAAVAREAARLGASVINDVWGLQRDPGMADAVAETGLGRHRHAQPRDSADPAIDILDDVERFFERSLAIAARAGVAFTRILLDPGVGFGKTPEQNHACIWNLDRFRRSAARSSSACRASRSSAGSLAISGFWARSPPTRSRFCAARPSCGCTTSTENRVALDMFDALERLRSCAARRRASARTGGRALLLALGGNVGDKAATLRRALRALGGEPGIELTAVSRLYRTAPWGKTDQDWFVNACALARTGLAPEALLDRVKALEVELGRKAGRAMGPARHRHRHHRL